MSRHVIIALHGVQVIRLALFHQMVEDALHIATHIGVGILVDGERRRGVLDEKMKQADLGQGAQLASYFIRY
jgi:hypothetical protein